MKLRVEGLLFASYVDGEDSAIEVAGGSPKPMIIVPVVEEQARQLTKHVGKYVLLTWINGELEITCLSSTSLHRSPSY